jgi:hypothetical protein
MQEETAIRSGGFICGIGSPAAGSGGHGPPYLREKSTRDKQRFADPEISEFQFQAASVIILTLGTLIEDGAGVEIVVKPNEDGSFLIAVSGSVNEYSQQGFRRIPSQVQNATAIDIDLGNVDVINSIGTIYWTEFLKQLVATCPVTMSNCSINVVDYLNRLPAMCKGAKVTSFHAPFRCTQCRRIFTRCLSVTEADHGRFPDTQCDKCGSTATEEVDFEDYTAFRAYCR